MRKRNIRSIFGFALLGALCCGQVASAIGQDKPKLTRDEVYRTIARQVNAQTESPMTDVLGVLDELIEVGEITVSDKDGKATVIVKEKVATHNPTNKTIRLVFAPAAGGKWVWESFENDRKLYPVERLYPYTKDDLGRRRQVTVVQWGTLVDAMTKQADAAFKVLDTAKVIIRSDPAPLGPVTTARAALAKARETNQADVIISAYKELARAAEPVATLSDSFPDLKTNDAYLRLQDELKGAQNRLAVARKDYVTSVAEYNEYIVRLPFALVAYGLGFQKIEPQIEAE